MMEHPLPCPPDLFTVDQDFETCDAPIPVRFTFAIFPQDEEASIYLRKVIKVGGGNLIPYEKKDSHPFVITLLNRYYFDLHPEENLKLHNDIYSSKFIWDYWDGMMEDNPRTVDLNEYLYTDSAYEKYDANDVLFRRKSWTQLTPLAVSPPLLNWKLDKENRTATLAELELARSKNKQKHSKSPPVIELQSQEQGQGNVPLSQEMEQLDQTRVADTPIQPLAHMNGRGTVQISPISPAGKQMVAKNVVAIPSSPSNRSDTQYNWQRLPGASQTRKRVNQIESDSNSDEAEEPRSSNKSPSKVIMDSQPVVGGPERNADGNIVRNRKGKHGKTQPAPDAWIEPSAEAGGVIENHRSHPTPSLAQDTDESVIDVVSCSSSDSGDEQRSSRINWSTELKNLHPNSKGGRGAYRPYTTAHGQAILNLILEKKWLQDVSGNAVWQHIENKGFLVKTIGVRTWHSLRNHWTKIITRDLNQSRGPTNYRITKEDFKAYQDSIKNRARKNGRGVKSIFI